MSDSDDLRTQLKVNSPTLWNDLTAKANGWTSTILDRLGKDLKDGYPKTFNDPIWGDILMYPWETLLLDSQLLQRLRGVRQLGMAHLVYPGAGYDRLEHSRGVVEAAERMIRSLERNANFRREFGKDKDEHVPVVSKHDTVAIRLAALLHDIGHGAFSHATEALIRSRLEDEFHIAAAVLRTRFSGVTAIAPAEIVASILILSEPLKTVFEHPHFGATTRPAELPLSICARVLGSRDYLDAGYLSGVISGPLDADKLDYMARDSHHAGLPIGLDLHRLISKLEVVTVTAETTANPEMQERARQSPHQRYHEIGISLSGLGAYEQMVIGRVILYDRLYYHHKVRSAEAMVRRLIRLAEEERGTAFTLQELFFDLPDDSVVFMLGGVLTRDGFHSGGERCERLASAIHNREIYYRAFAFAPRFIAGLRGLPDNDRRDARAILWTKVLGELSTLAGSDDLANEIYEKTKSLCEKIPELVRTRLPIEPEHIVVDLPIYKTAVRGGDILTRTEDGYVAPPHLFFDPEKWSQAYEHQKQCGFVFTPREYVRAVGLAARIVFYERYQLVMDTGADRASKTAGDIKPNWLTAAAKLGLCGSDCADAYQQDTVRLVPIRIEDLEKAIPDDIRRDKPDLAKRLHGQFSAAIPVGIAPSLHQKVIEGIRHLFLFLISLQKGGDFVGLGEIDEKRNLQAKLKSHLLAREAKVVEGSEVGGGETDLVLSDELVIENKIVRNPTISPLTVGEKFSWQARRYAIAVAQRVVFEVVAYKPSNELAILPISDCVVVSEVPFGSSTLATVRFVTPWGHAVPSGATPPAT
ncbi:MAG: HD domain-containing protein [Planctomycetaceae bacterium]